MTKLLWFWISMMQLFNGLSLLDVHTPENVLKVQEEFNDIIHLQFLSKEMIDDILNVIYAKDKSEIEANPE